MRARGALFTVASLFFFSLVGSAFAKNSCRDNPQVQQARAAIEQTCDCAGADNHGSYVRCVAKQAKIAAKNGDIPKNCRGAIVSCAAKSTCGRPGAVTCCHVDDGQSKCSIEKSAEACAASGGHGHDDGLVCVGSATSCCDACGGGCPGGSTTTTTQAPTTTTAAPTTTTTGAPTTTTAAPTTTTTGAPTTTTAAPTTTTTGAPTTTTTGAPTTTTTGASTTVTTSTVTSTSTTTVASTTVPTTTSTTTLASTTTVTTTTTLATTTTTTLACCPAGQIVTSSSPGVLLVSTLAPFPFPAGVITTVNVGAADATCKHNVVVPAGGFTVPVFCIPALGFTSQVEASGCESGTGDGAGMVWDASSPCADADVFRVGDTSDPDSNACGTLAAGCNTAGAGAGNDTAGNIDTTRGNGSCDSAAGVKTQLDIPVLSTTWNDVDGNCPDDDLTFDAGTDVLITQFTFILSPTTATTSADFTDLNSDSCSFAGNGPDHTKHCSLNSSRPCASNTHCTNPPPNDGTCVDGPIVGTPPTGPCCVVGQTTTVVASGIGFTGGAPLFDLLFANQTPASITACNAPPAAQSCVVTTNPCQD